MIVNPDGSVIVSADPRGPIVDINDYLYGPWIASIMQRAQSGGSGTLGPSPWEQKIPARKQTQKGSGQGGTQRTQRTQQTQQTQQRQANSLASLLQLGQDLYRQAIQPVVMQAPQEITQDATQETAGIYPEYTFDWGPWALGSAGIGAATMAAAAARDMLKRPSVTYLGYTPNALPAPPTAALPEPPNAKLDFRPIRGLPTPPLPTPIENSVSRAMAQTPNVLPAPPIAALPESPIQVPPTPPLPTPIEYSAPKAITQTPAAYKSLKELDGTIDRAKVAAGDLAESIKAKNWRTRFGWERSIYDAADQMPLNELYGSIDWTKVAAGDPVESIKAENWRTRFEWERAIYDAADQQPLKELHGDIDWTKVAAGDPAERIKAENWRNRFGWEESVYNRELSQAARPQATSSLSQLVGRNLKTFGSQLKGNAKIMAPIGLGLIGLSKLLEGSPAEAASQPSIPTDTTTLQAGQPDLSGLSEWGQVMYSTLPDQEKAQVASMSPAQQASWEKAETIKREGLQDAWNPLESLLYAPMAAGGSLVRMLANFLSDAVFQNAMLYGMSDGE